MTIDLKHPIIKKELQERNRERDYSSFIVRLENEGYVLMFEKNKWRIRKMPIVATIDRPDSDETIEETYIRAKLPKDGIWKGCGHPVKMQIIDNNPLSLSMQLEVLDNNPEELCTECYWKKEGE